MSDDLYSPEEDSERIERIPWSELLPQARRSRSWPAYAALGTLVLAALLFAASRRPVVAPTVTLAVPEVEPAPVTVPVPVPSLPLPAARPDSLYSEADLMAAVPERGSEAITGRAEWFVYDYFTGSGDGWDSATRHLPEDVFGAQGPPARGLSYVEWARAVEVKESGSDAYDVLVVFRMVAPDGDQYRRLSVRAVTVRIRMNVEGVPTVVDLPEPAAVPQARSGGSWGEPGQPSPEVVADAYRRVEEWGREPELLWAGLSDEGWRLVISVTDEAGNRWPFGLRVPGD